MTRLCRLLLVKTQFRANEIPPTLGSIFFLSLFSFIYGCKSVNLGKSAPAPAKKVRLRAIPAPAKKVCLRAIPAPAKKVYLRAIPASKEILIENTNNCFVGKVGPDPDAESSKFWVRQNRHKKVADCRLDKAYNNSANGVPFFTVNVYLYFVALLMFHN